MNRKQHFIAFCALLLISLFISGCDALQSGSSPTVYLIPTMPPTVVAEVSPLPPTATPTTILPTVTLIPTLTATIRPCDETEGRIVDQSLFSAQASAEVRYQIYLPPCYSQSQQRYPVLYMLHGMGAGMDDMQWIRVGLTDAANLGFTGGTLPPMIIVMPNGNNAGYTNDAGAFPEFVVNDLIPNVEANFCTWNQPAMRAIGGLSRGGFFAYWIAFQYPQMFGRVGGHSPYLYDPSFANEENPFNLVDTAPIENLVMYMDHGGYNREIKEVQPGVLRMQARLKARGLEAQYVANPIGDHDESYWAIHTTDYLTFYTEAWPRSIAEYPSCTQSSP